MATASLSGASLTAVHQAFLDELPRIETILRFQFRNWPRRRRAEAIADARAFAWAAWAGLVRRGQDPRAVGPTGIAFNASRSVKAGRTLGRKAIGRAAIDVYDRRAQTRDGFEVVSLDEPVEGLPEARHTLWKEWIVADNRCTPASAAAFRLDFATWLDSLPARKRAMAELLAQGYETGVVAATLGVTPGAVSQTRSWLAARWEQFEAQAAAL